MSASTGASISGHQTSAPVAFAIGATAPMWSKWVWVRRIPSMVRPSSSVAPRIRSASSPGSTIRARSEPSFRNTKQFSAIWPTVNMRTSTAASALRLLGAARAAGLALLALLLLLAEVALVEEAVHQEGHRDVEAEHQDPYRQRGERILTEQREQSDEQDRSDAALLECARPARRLRLASAGVALLLGPAARPVLRLGATTRPAASRAGVDPAALGAAVLAATLLLRLRHAINLAEDVLDHVTHRIEIADR